ncbi:MAG: DinB family protein [Gemmatimonadota bacterium]
MTSELLLPLLRHARWANDEVFAALSTGADAVPAAALDQFRHILGAEHVWLQRIEGRPRTVAVWPDLTVAEMEPLARENSGRLIAVASGSDEELARTVDYVNTAGVSFTSRVVDILLHVALHGCYHRGMVSSLMRTAGVRPAPTDFIAFIRGTPAARTAR